MTVNIINVTLKIYDEQKLRRLEKRGAKEETC